MAGKQEKGFVLWFTGLPCSGKTTVADLAAERLKKYVRKVERLDGDIVRKTLSSDLGFSRQDRAENIKRVAFMAKLLSRNGVGVVASFISPYRQARQKIREDVTNFIEIFVDCPSQVCRNRDVKGMYRLAEKNQIRDFTGVSAPYQKPLNPEVTLHTEKESPEESCLKILEYLKSKEII